MPTDPNLEEQLRQLFQGKSVLITGATGTIGQALTRRILTYAPRVIRLFSRDEHKQYMMRQKLGDLPQLRYLIGDVRDLQRVNRAVEGVDIVLHTAALKHVPVCEYDPFEAVKTNVIGTQNMILACMQHGVKHLLLTSSDKAIMPPNTLGATKLLAERLMTSAAYAKGTSPTIFTTVRFGNVIGSRGSAINQFIESIRNHAPLKVTDMNMTRFIMSIDQAVTLVLKSVLLSHGGDIFVLKMPVVKLGDLVFALIDSMHGKRQNIEIIGLRPGEKMHEELLSEEEAKGALEREDMFVLPAWWRQDAHYADAVPATGDSYCSKDVPVLNGAEIVELLSACDADMQQS